MPIAISRLLVLSLRKPAGALPYSVLNRTQTKSRLCLSPQCKSGVIGVTSTNPPLDMLHILELNSAPPWVVGGIGTDTLRKFDGPF